MTTTSIDELFAHNREWAEQMERDRPAFFTGSLAQQKPRYMWIGCPTAACRLTRSRAGARRGVRAPQRCQRGRAHRSHQSTIQYAVDQLAAGAPGWSWATTAAAACWRRCRMRA